MSYTDPFGIDTADCNGPVNITAPGAPKVYYGAARCGIGFWYKDAEYLNTRRQYDKLGLPFVAYHVLVPGKPILSQARSFKAWAGSDCYAYSWDLEVANGCSPSKVSVDTRDALAATEDFGWNQLPYSSPGWINEYFRNPVTHQLPDWVNRYWWWLSQYLLSGVEHPGPVDIPAGMDPKRVLIHQTGSQMPNLYGSKYDSRFVDTNRARIWPFPGFNGSPVIVPEVPVIVTPTVPTRVMHVVNCNGLFIRPQPKKAGATLGLLLRGSEVNVVKRFEVGSDIWWSRVEGGYCAEVYQGFRYLR
ncbi:hypothetical protein CCP3SC15_480004 [Gammaproteobacteria bacterium]